MDLISQINTLFAAIANPVINPEHRIYLIYVVSMIVICYFIYRRAKINTGFFKWLFPAEIYFHPSHLTDLKLFAFNHLLRLAGFFNIIVVSSSIAALTMGAIGGADALDSTWNPLWVGLLLLTVNDFGVYWVHRIHHETSPLWPFHSVHHSAEVMTPITVYRKHPIYDLISSIVRGLFFGILQGVMLGLFVGNIGFSTIAGINAFLVMFNFFGANLRHSHVWLGYGRFLEHIFISPAQHQIHHSIDTKHWNKNYGEIFALWDWMFGTLYVPRNKEELKFGLTDADGVIQPHDTFTNAILGSMKE